MDRHSDESLAQLSSGQVGPRDRDALPIVRAQCAHKQFAGTYLNQDGPFTSYAGWAPGIDLPYWECAGA